MQRRDVLECVGATAAAASMAGCGLLGGCGPGEDRIGDLANEVESETPTPGPESTRTAEEVRVKGSIDSASQEEVVISDGTGTARLLAIGGFYMKNVDSGDCAWATGFPTEPDDGEDVDVTILITEVGLEE